MAAAAAAAAAASAGAGAPQRGASASGVRVTSALTKTDFEFGPVIGVGTFSRVYVATHIASRRVWAIKCMSKAECMRLQQADHVRSERAILESNDHPFIVGFGGTFQDERCAYIVMEFAQGGELFTHLRKAGRFPNDTARFYAAQCALALEHLHRRSVIYRDLKPENVVLDSRGFVRLVDLGFAKRVAFKTFTLCGTPEYIAPEMLLNRGHDTGADWWALGVLVFEMLAGQAPFIDDDPMGVYGQIIEGTVVFPKFMERGARSIIKRLLQPDPTKRLGCLRRGAAEVREHRFFDGFDWDGAYGKTIAAPIVPDLRGPTDVNEFDPYPDEDDHPTLPAYEGDDPFAEF